MSAELARHIGHRCVLLDPRRLRCVDCTHTVLLPAMAGSTSTSQSPIPGPDDPRCPQHLTEHAGNCRACAADAKASRAADANHGHRQLPHQPTADVAARAAEARAALPRRTPRPQPAPEGHPS